MKEPSSPEARGQMKKPLRILVVEDSVFDADLIMRELERCALRATFERVETAAGMKAALDRNSWNVVLADHALPQFSAPAALALLKERGLDLPFIVVSGTIGEETAAAMIKAGAGDCIMKGKLTRLAPAIVRELREAKARADHRRAEAEVRKSREQLRALAARLEGAREEERMRISREIHDEFGEVLTGLKLGLTWIRQSVSEPGGTIPWPEVFDKMDVLMALTDATANRVRKMCTELRPSVLDDLGLVSAIEWQAREFEARTSIRCDAKLPAEPFTVGDQETTALFRIFQEILTNVARHARASKVRVVLKKTGAAVVLEVKDNGRGITREEIAGVKSLGLLGMQERAALFGGRLEFRGEPGKGTTVRARVPIPQNNTNVQDRGERPGAKTDQKSGQH